LKKITKILVFVLVATMLVGIFAGCSPTPEGKAVLNAIIKSQDIKSMESKATFKINFDASGVSPEQKPTVDQVKAYVNGAEIFANTKTIMTDKLAVKGKIDLGVNVAGMSVQTSAWVDTDMTGEKMKIYEVFQIPAMLAGFMPQKYVGKEYLVMDFEKMMNMPEFKEEMKGMDFSKVMDFSKEMSLGMVDFMKEYAAQYNPGFEYIKDMGEQEVTTPVGKELAHIYQVKLDDKMAKKLLRYSVTNMAENEKVMAFVKDYMDMMVGMTGASMGVEEKKEMDKMLKDMEAGVPAFVTEFNKAMDKIENVQFIAEEGIVINYAINKDGYMIKENGKLNFVFDMAELSKIEGSQVSEIGVYNIGIDYNSDIYNINKVTAIEFPEVTKENSIDYVDMMKDIMASSKPEVMPNKSIEIGKSVTITQQGKTYIPGRKAAELLKCQYVYSKGAATITYNGNTVIVKPNETKLKFNGQEVDFGQINGFLKSNTFYVLPDIYEMLGVKIIVK